ncbi:MAG TPA: hypothetical protein V6C65_01435 [Allocoleopsis sp.]
MSVNLNKKQILIGASVIVLGAGSIAIWVLRSAEYFAFPWETTADDLSKQLASPVPPLQPGEYLTKAGYFAAITEKDLIDTTRAFKQGDEDTFNRLTLSGDAIVMRGGLTVFVEGCGNTTCSVVVIRPEGRPEGQQPEKFYTLSEALEAPQRSTSP